MRETILVADGNIEFLDQTRSILTHHNYHFVQAMSGEEARMKLEQDDIDFCLVNQSLPPDTGLSLCQFVREDLQLPIPVALMVGQGDAYPPHETLDLVDGVLVRPLRPQELINCLHHLRVIRYFLQENAELRRQIAQGVPAAPATPIHVPEPTPQPVPEPTPQPAPQPAVPVESSPDDTALYPMPWFKRLAALEVQRAIRFRQPLSLLLLAFDLTEPILQQTPEEDLAYLSAVLAQNVRDVIRSIDIPVQFSRDHILILLPNTGVQGVLTAADRIRSAVLHLMHQELAGRYQYTIPTISIGATTSSTQESFQFTDLLRDATRALREVRANGGDGVFYG